MKQTDTILTLLLSGHEVCGSTFLKMFVPEYRSRINELRKQGYDIKGSKCTIHNHQQGNLKMWWLSNHKEYTQQPAIKTYLGTNIPFC